MEAKPDGRRTRPEPPLSKPKRKVHPGTCQWLRVRLGARRTGCVGHLSRFVLLVGSRRKSSCSL
jgi:hypothetical protein